MKVTTITYWDEVFFQKFINFKNKIHSSLISSFPEKLQDYERFFSPASCFKEDYFWIAFLVDDGNEVRAKAILSWRKSSRIGNLGFVDWENDKSAAKLLVDEVEKVARTKGLQSLKTPVDLNFYIKYRIRLPGGGTPFWGEPVYPDYYHELFKLNGFEEIGRWDTFKVNRFEGIKDYFLKRMKLARKTQGSHSKTKEKSLRTTIRCVRLNDWENELRIIHGLFNEAYKNMPEWEPITFEQFRVSFNDFRYIINPLYAYILELRGRPVGFSINFADPLPVLISVKGKELGTVGKILLLARLRTNRSTFVIAHVGKVPGPEGEEIKGVQIQVSKRIQVFASMMKKVLVTFQMKDSPSRRSFDQKYMEPYAEYVLYGKEL